MIEVAHQHRTRRFSKKETLRVVRFVLQREGRHSLQVSVVFTDDRFIKQINRDFLDHDDVTDVIAFPLDDRMEIDAELYVNLDQARRQAIEYGIRMHEEVKRLLVHGTLHIVGYRDTAKSRRDRMLKRENRLLSLLMKGH